MLCFSCRSGPLSELPDSPFEWLKRQHSGGFTLLPLGTWVLHPHPQKHSGSLKPLLVVTILFMAIIIILYVYLRSIYLSFGLFVERARGGASLSEGAGSAVLWTPVSATEPPLQHRGPLSNSHSRMALLHSLWKGLRLSSRFSLGSVSREVNTMVGRDPVPGALTTPIWAWPRVRGRRLGD